MKLDLTRNFLVFAWILMLFVGNLDLGIGLDYWGAIPGGLLIAWLANRGSGLLAVETTK